MLGHVRMGADVMFLLLLALGPLEPQAAPFEALVAKVSVRLEKIRDFEAEFVQRVHRPAFRKQIEERGTVAIKKPGRMRWEYRSPEQKLFVSDGRKTYFYIPEENQVIVSHKPAGALALTDDSPLALVAGSKKLEELFRIEPSSSPAETGGSVLRLIPKTPSAELAGVEIEVDSESGSLRRVILVDVQHNKTEFVFEGVRENRGLSENLFRFVAPPGVQILLADKGLPTSR